MMLIVELENLEKPWEALDDVELEKLEKPWEALDDVDRRTWKT